MIKRKKDEFNPFDSSFTDGDDFAEAEPDKKYKPVVKESEYKPLNMMTPIEFVTSNTENQSHINWMRKFSNNDPINNFILAATIAPWTGQGFLGRVKTINPKGLIQHLVEANDQYFKGTRLQFVANLGAQLSPFPLLELYQSVEWLRENEPDVYADYRSQGMFSPAHILDKVINSKSFTLVASIDIVGVLEVSNLRAARHVLANLVSAGNTAILTYSDEDVIRELDKKQIFREIKTFDIGSY